MVVWSIHWAILVKYVEKSLTYLHVDSLATPKCFWPQYAHILRQWLTTMTFHFVVKSLSDLVNESLTLSEEDAVAAASVATSSRLSPSGSASTSPHQQTTTATSTSPTPMMATATGTTTTAFPRLSSLASEAIDDLPSVKLLKRLQPPTHKLIAITKSMNHHLTSLLVSFINGIPLWRYTAN